MFLTKLKMALVLALFMGITGTAATVLSYRATAGDGKQGGKEALVVAAAIDDKPRAADGDDEEDPQRDVAADRVRSQNNLKQIGLAIIKYHDANGHFPTAAIYSKNDKPLPRLGGVFNNGFHAMVADGSMHFVKQKDEKTLKKWITRAGGEVVYGSDLDP
ncbi:MAG TPA: DUF1559 domain-containing protein [Gemmataceae bacterium]|nr:DUF1559 domain-containing protein [Gemmataceae bacterium]